MEPLRILIVDDSGCSRVMTKASLNGIECEVDEAEDGEAALAKFRRGKYDLVLMDIQMPQTDGYVAAREIRRWERKHKRWPVSIIALTAQEQAQAAMAARQAGCDGYVAKPFNKAALHAAIRAATGLDIGSPAADTQVQAAQAPRGLAQRLFGRRSKAAETPEEHGALEALRPKFLADKLREVDVVMLALQHRDYKTARMLALRLKGEGVNFGFREITEIGGELAKAVEKTDPKEARKLAQKLAAYLSKVEESYQ